MNVMKRNKKLLLMLGLVLIISLAVPAFASGESFETNSYDVGIKVKEDNSFSVQEEIGVSFLEPRHGIYRYIQYSGTVTRQWEGRLIQQPYRMKIKNIQVPGYDFDVTTEFQDGSGYLVIRIGSPDFLVDGNQKYQILYDVSLYDDGISEFDDVYWNLLPHN